MQEQGRFSRGEPSLSFNENVNGNLFRKFGDLNKNEE